jgi:hypothetical protein
MESNESLFSLSIDPVTKSHLNETARWAKFLAITGMVFLILMIVFGVVGSSIFINRFAGMPGAEGANLSSYASIGIAVYMIIIAVIWFFPLMYTLRFANQMRRALAGNDQQLLNLSFQNLKITMRYLGVVTIVVLAIYAIIIVVALFSAGMVS